MHPTHRDPHPMIFKNLQNLTLFTSQNYIFDLSHRSQPDLRYTNIFPTTLYVCGSPFLHPWAQRDKDKKFRILNPERQRNSGNCYCYCTPPTVTPTPWFSNFIKIHQFLNSKITYSIYASDPNPIWGTQTFFPQHFMFVGLLFYIPEHNETKIRNSEFSTPSGSETVEIVIVIAPLPPWPPPHDFQILSKFINF